MNISLQSDTSENSKKTLQNLEPWSPHIMNGNLEEVKRMYYNNEGCYSYIAMNLAAGYNQLDILKFFHENNFKCTTFAIDIAASKGYLEVVRWLYLNIPECKNLTYCPIINIEIAIDEYLNFVKLLPKEEQISEIDIDFIKNTISMGHSVVVQQISPTKRGAWPMSTMDFAASSGHLEIVQWLRSQSKEYCVECAKEWASHLGHINVTNWLALNKENTLSAKEKKWFFFANKN
jgi:hypothetical protein